MLSIQKKIFLAAVIPVALIYNLLFIVLQWQYARYEHLRLLPMVIAFVVIQCLIFLAIWLASDLISRAFISISEAIDRIAIGDSNQQSAASHGTVNDCLSRMTPQVAQRDKLQCESLATSFDRLLGSLGQGMFYFTHDREGYLQYLSPSIRELSGIGDDIGSYRYTFLHSDGVTIEQALAETEKVLNGAEIGAYEAVIKNTSGKVFHFEVIKIPVYDRQGNIVGVEGVGRDITRWISDVAHFKGLLQYAPDAMVITDDRGMVVMVNARAEVLLGYRSDHLLGKRICSFISNEHWHAICAGRRTPAALANPSGVEITITTRTGAVMPVELTMNTIKTPDGLRYSLCMRDIAKRRAAEQALYASEQRYRRTIDALQKEYIFYSQRLDGSFINVTPSVQSILGYTPEYFMANWFKSMSRDSDRGLIRRVFNTLRQGGSHPSYQLEVTKADGSIAILEIYESAAYNDQGEMVAIEGLACDRTRERRAALALAEARDNAEAANEAKTLFLSNMSHELRTPLNGILGYAQLLTTQANITPEQHDQLLGIQACGQHLLLLINDILDLTKAESGHLTMTPRPFNLMELIDSIYRMICPQAEAQRLAMKLTVSPQVPAFIIGDEMKIRQVLINLLGNAIKFTEAGSVSLTVSGHQQMLSFVVQDTGIGIAPDQLQSIFSPFRQGSAGLRKGGTGLGLAISQRIANAMQGTLEVTSELTVGSRFVFSIPAHLPLGFDDLAGPSLPVTTVAANTDDPLLPDLPAATAAFLGQLITENIEIGDIAAIRQGVAELRDGDVADRGDGADICAWLDLLIRQCDELDIEALSRVAGDLSGGEQLRA